jgi:monoamine oxidase
MTDSYQVIVIGGGAAGIGAARRLALARVDYLMVEARSRFGGRAWTVEGDFPLDLGCGWLHSADENPWVKIAEAQDATIDRTPPPWEKPFDQPGFPQEEQAAFGNAFGEFYERLDGAAGKPDAPASSLLEPGGRWNHLINAVSTYINGVELEKISTDDYARYHDTWVNWRVREGYGWVISGAAQGLNAMLDCPVTEIDHSGKLIIVRTARGPISADAVIVTLPSAVLAEGRVRFTPALPEKQEFAAALPLGLADKLYFWLDGMEEFEKDSRLFGQIDAVGTAAYHMRPFGRPLIEAYFGGALADDLEREGERAFADFATWELAKVLGSDFPKRIRPLNCSLWRTDEYARGSYSYALPGHHGDRVKLAAPVDNRIYFAGEACSQTDFSTAHGALVNGREAAEKVLASLGIA